MFLADKNPDERWLKVYFAVVAKYKYEREEMLVDMLYKQHKRRYNILKTLNITKENYYYSVRKILNFAFTYAKELKLI